jgi:hypothetical protein
MRRICSLAAIPASRSRSGGGAQRSASRCPEERPSDELEPAKASRHSFTIVALWHNIFRATADLRAGATCGGIATHERDRP